jgi:hypothetical protein
MRGVWPFTLFLKDLGARGAGSQGLNDDPYRKHAAEEQATPPETNQLPGSPCSIEASRVSGPAPSSRAFS